MIQALVPPCSGTREFLESLKEDILTISVSKFHSLYHSIDLDTAIKVWTELDNFDSLPSSFQTIYGGGKRSINANDRKSILDAVKQLRNSEMMFLVMYFQKLITKDYFDMAIRRIVVIESHAQAIIQVASSIVNTQNNFLV